jgi:hypothetical protein
MNKRSVIGWCLALVFVTALLMGPGPGMQLANRPVRFLGFPALYVWALIWYVVEVSVVVLAYLFVWSSDDDPLDDS